MKPAKHTRNNRRHSGNRGNRGGNRNSANLNTAKRMLSRKVRKYFDNVMEEIKEGGRVPIKFRDYMMRLLEEDMSDESFNNSLYNLLEERKVGK